MSTVESPAGPRTINAPVNGTGTVSFTLPPGITLDLQAVFATIDATAAGATTAELTISEQSGVVIAKKRQGETVDAGVTGSATWALRLGDESAPPLPPAVTAYEAFKDPGTFCATGAPITTLPFVYDFGDVLGSFAGTRYTIFDAGTYALALWINAQATVAAYTLKAVVRVTFGGTAQAAVLTTTIPPGFALSGGGPTFAVTRTFAAGDELDVRTQNNSAAGVNLQLVGGLAKLA